MTGPTLPMKKFIKSNLLLILLIALVSCSTKKDSSSAKEESRKSVEMITDYGTIIIELYNETPLHRDNFLKLTNEGAFDSLLFHRVINEFMIQSGDPDSRNANPDDKLGEGDLPYTIDAEFNKALFHKRGALGAARDGNPERASSSMQFYIVQRGVQADSSIDKSETRINGWLADHFSNNDPANKELVEALKLARESEDQEEARLLNDSLRNLAKAYTDFEKYKIPEAHRSVYKSLGGTPHLDQNYTVFGEVVTGLEVVDSIAHVQTGEQDRPLADVRIRSVRVVERQ